MGSARIKEMVERPALKLAAVVILGQLLCLCVALSGVTSQLLANANVNLPTTQNTITYLTLLCVYLPVLAWKGQLGTAFRKRWWKYALVAACDLEANYLMVLAYRYTSLASVQILDCFTIPCAMLLSYHLLHAHYSLTHLGGAAVSVCGVVLLLFADSDRAQGSLKWAWLGDLLCLFGALLYALSNVCQELLVKQQSVPEFLGMLGFFGTIFASIQAVVLEGRDVMATTWSIYLVRLMLAYGLCLFIFYSGVPFVIRFTSSSFLNVTLLCADIYSLLFSVLFFAMTFDNVYVGSFFTIALGIGLYSWQPVSYRMRLLEHSMAGNTQWSVYQDDDSPQLESENDPLLPRHNRLSGYYVDGGTSSCLLSNKALH